MAPAMMGLPGAGMPRTHPDQLFEILERMAWVRHKKIGAATTSAAPTLGPLGVQGHSKNMLKTTSKYAF